MVYATPRRKPDKIRVVFDCSAQLKGISLNNKVFQGPDITNNLARLLIPLLFPIWVAKQNHFLSLPPPPLAQGSATGLD